MSDNIQDLILFELRAFRKETNDKLDNHGNRLSVVETKLDPLLDNGQPGRITKIEDSLDDLNRWKYYFLGGVAMLVEGLHWVGHKIAGGN